MENLDTLVLKTTVAESARARLKPGSKVRVESIGAAASTDDAVVRTILPSADAVTRRVPVEIEVPNADGRFVAFQSSGQLTPKPAYNGWNIYVRDLTIRPGKGIPGKGIKVRTRDFR